MKILLLVLAVLAVVCIILFNSFRSRTNSTVSSVEHGPFTIQMEEFFTRNFDMNYGMVTNVSIKYSVLYKGTPVQFSKNLQNNTGYPHMWRVYILADAPVPTLIAGSQSLYLITEEKNNVKVMPLDEQGHDFASLQFLDGNGGQPATFFEVFMATGKDSDKKIEVLKGGEYLLVNEHAVLHIPGLKRYEVNKNNNLLDNYSFQHGSGAIAFSPDKKWMAFMGDFATYNTNEEPRYPLAIVVYNYEEDKGYTVPFSKNRTRLKDQFHVTKDWVDTYFEWVGGQSNYQLKLKNLPRLPHWQGMYEDEGELYELNNVKPEIQQELIRFILQKYNLADTAVVPGGEYSTDELNIILNGLKLAVWYRKEDKQLLLMKNVYEPESEEYKRIIHAVGDAFNKAMSEGKYQKHFIED